ncbi:MAG: hypothetical protein JO171_13435 [Paludibacterium sp.]|uniref:hypothetical protein n=1 Tax=Paludibacterium sp. TaxID=1917523 RepID=UPI0025D592F1|nr:hypothetical protein [Paludibacterium sp.]MBV8048157.1 hypothetical protein [Paludibacterium sp.]MBV8648123.1 hypothetical protein [Paludibacterium sp.]
MQDLTLSDPNSVRRFCRRWLLYRLPQELIICVLLYLAAGRNGLARDLQMMTILMATAVQLTLETLLLSHMLNKVQASLSHARASSPPADPPAPG